ncbi:hypothetical protein BDZ91DRAFT_766757 [Kalaharituber pfeilii]|nr:hypothetical protein BDZ91DRAFT_766757 [Kalaharituber pfeilii]
MGCQSATSFQMTRDSISAIQQKPAEPSRDCSAVTEKENEVLKSHAHGSPQQAVESPQNCKHAKKLVQHGKDGSVPHARDSHHPQEPTPPEQSQYHSRLSKDAFSRLENATDLDLLPTPMERFLLLDETESATVYDLLMTKALLFPQQ